MSRVSDYIRSAANPRKDTAKKRVTVRLTEDEFTCLSDLADVCGQKPTPLAERLMSAAIKDAVDTARSPYGDDDPFGYDEEAETAGALDVDAVVAEALASRNGHDSDEQETPVRKRQKAVTEDVAPETAAP